MLNMKSIIILTSLPSSNVLYNYKQNCSTQSSTTKCCYNHSHSTAGPQLSCFLWNTLNKKLIQHRTVDRTTVKQRLFKTWKFHQEWEQKKKSYHSEARRSHHQSHGWSPAVWLHSGRRWCLSWSQRWGGWRSSGLLCTTPAAPQREGCFHRCPSTPPKALEKHLEPHTSAAPRPPWCSGSQQKALELHLWAQHEATAAALGHGD